MSFNKPEKNAKWVAKEAFPFEVWSDPDRSLAQQLGAANGPKQLSPKRVTRVLDAAARVVLSYDEVNVGAHPEQVLQDCRERWP